MTRMMQRFKYGNLKWKNVRNENRSTTSLATLPIMPCDFFFPNTHSLLTILATLQVTTATAESSLSTVRRLKTRLRNNMGEQRLIGIVLMNIYRNNKINVEAIINRFARLPLK